MSEKIRERLVASFTLPAMADAIVGAEAVAAAGYDAEDVLAVLPAHCAYGGVVNSNREVYPPGELAAEHLRLSSLAKQKFVPGEAGHPKGPPTFDVAVRFLGGEVEATESGAVVAKGAFAVLNTTRGRDIMVCWRQGMAIGVSLRGAAFKTPHLLDEKSPYTALNTALAGQSVWLRDGLELEAYDPVPVPAFNTFFAPKGEALAAFQRLVMSDSDNVPAAAGQQETDMPGDKNETPPAAPKIETVEQLRAAHGPLVETLVKTAVAAALKQERENDPLSGLDEAQTKTLHTMAKALKGDGPKALVAAAKEAGDIARERMTAAEERIEALEKRNAEAEARTIEAKAAQAKAEAAIALRDALDTKCKGVAQADALRTFVMAEATAGKIVSAAEAGALFDRLLALQAGTKPPASGDTTASAGDNGKPEAPAPATAADDTKRQAPGLLNTRHSLADALKARRSVATNN